MKRYLTEVQAFARQGSVFALALAVAIGVAFAKIVESMVNDIIVPLLAGLFGKADFTGLFIPLANPPAVPPTLEMLKKVGVPIVAYGNLLAAILNFVVLALAIVVVVRYLNRLERRGDSVPAQARDGER